MNKLVKIALLSLLLAFIMTNASVIARHHTSDVLCAPGSTQRKAEDGAGTPKAYYIDGPGFNECRGADVIFSGSSGSRYVYVGAYIVDLIFFVPIAAVLVLLLWLVFPKLSTYHLSQKQLKRLIIILAISVLVSAFSATISRAEEPYICYSEDGRIAKVDRGFPLHYYQQGLTGECGKGANISGLPQDGNFFNPFAFFNNVMIWFAAISLVVFAASKLTSQKRIKK